MNKAGMTEALLASLSVAAGAFASGGSAEAAVVVHTYNQDIGWMHSATSAGAVSLEILPSESLSFGVVPDTVNTANHGVAIAKHTGTGSIWFSAPLTDAGSTSYYVARSVSAGARGASVNRLSSALLIGGSQGGALLPGSPANTPQYYQFAFGVNQKSYWGWLSGSRFATSFDNMGFHLNRIVYDTTKGEVLAAGTTSVPEPSSLGLLALGAFVTGAVATRRYKQARGNAVTRH